MQNRNWIADLYGASRFVEFLCKNRWRFPARHPRLPGMGRKQRKLVVTVTERWTFVFDDEGEATAAPPAIDSPPPAPSSSPDADAALLLTGDPDLTTPASTTAPAASPDPDDNVL